MPENSPTAPAERIVIMDALRGFAVLGILIMNIQSFSMIDAAYLNPAAHGDLTGVNKWVWIFSHLFADQKFMSLFSMLFGAGVILMTAKRDAAGLSAASLHYRRTFWLLVLGLAHAHLIWHGDILVTYALCALGVFLFRKRSPRFLLILGLIVFSVSSALYIYFGLAIPYWPDEMVREFGKYWSPDSEAVSRTTTALLGGFAEQMEYRVPAALSMETLVFLVFLGWRAGGMMLIGMALFKWGVITGRRSPRFYSRLAAAGFLIGLPVIVTGMVRNYSEGWTFEYSMYLGSQFNYWGSLFVALGFVGLCMRVFSIPKMRPVTSALAATGRMAFTNYLLQSIICTTIFYGHGLGLFGRVDRLGQILIVISVCVFEIILSNLWLRRFRFGPAEWLWRSLTYFRFQPFYR